MTFYEVGQSLRWGIKVFDINGALADTEVTPTCTVTLPDGTSSAASVDHPGLGNYTALLTSTQPGRYRPRWTCTGQNTGGFPYTDIADVLPADPRFLISLAEARAALNLPTAVTADDDELRVYLAAATPVIEAVVGPVLSATKIETSSGQGRQAIPLHEYPTSVTTVVEDGVTLTANTDYCWDEYGLLWRGSKPMTMGWSNKAPRNVAVTYVVGAGVVPPNVTLGTRELVRFMYQIGQQGQRPAFGTSSTMVVGPGLPSGFLVPHRVMEALAPSTGNRMPSLA